MPFSPEARELAQKVSNWGRWGDDDQVGCGNLLTAEATARGLAAVRTNERISLAVDLVEEGIQMGQPAGRFNAVVTPTSLNERDKMAPGIWFGTDDMVSMSTCAGTHIDGLCHVGYDDQLYGGRPSSTIGARNGATWCGVEHLPSIVTRALLVDVPRVRGVDILPAGTAVTAADLDAAIDGAGITVESGDVILVRTGDITFYLAGDRRRYAVGENWQCTGLGATCIEWFADRDVAGVFSDTYTYEVMPPESGNWDDLLVVHMIQLRDMGLLQGQNWNLEDLAVACAEQNRIDVLLLAAPEPIVGATSAPVHPVAVL